MNSYYFDFIFQTIEKIIMLNLFECKIDSTSVNCFEIQMKKYLSQFRNINCFEEVNCNQNENIHNNY